jgi:hypothetical protein
LQRLTPAIRASILTIKAACWQHPEYRRAFSSADIYEAVLEHHVAGLAEFGRYLRERSISAFEYTVGNGQNC